jgi:hypothetical protein
MALLPAFTAGASTKGDAPHSSLCASLHSLAPALSTDSTAYAKAFKAHKWAAEKAAYLSGLTIQVEEYSLLDQASSSAPKNVRSAVPSAIKAASSLRRDLDEAKSALDFASPGSSVVILAFNAAQKPLVAFFDKQCGS